MGAFVQTREEAEIVKREMFDIQGVEVNITERDGGFDLSGHNYHMEHIRWFVDGMRAERDRIPSSKTYVKCGESVTKEQQDKINVIYPLFKLLDNYDQNELNSGISWFYKDDEDKPITFLVNCNDFFWWGTADGEEITIENLSILKQCFEDLQEYPEEYMAWTTLLYCARVRKLRPQGAVYKAIPKELHELFDSCGPEREIDICNPYTQGNEYKYKKEE